MGDDATVIALTQLGRTQVSHNMGASNAYAVEDH
jgi:hypothetical protein